MFDIVKVQLAEITDYNAFRDTLGKELTASAESFVRIGYLLKKARDTDILKESGYSSLADFARNEYGLSKDVVSRYIAINDKYSEEGNSEFLKKEYQGFGYTKLAEMLTLPDSLIEEVSLEMTREEIREIKEAVKEEEKTSEIELYMERVENPVPDSPAGILEKALESLFKSLPDTFCALYDICKTQEDIRDDKIKRLKELLFPAGYGLFETRVKGVGGIWISGGEASLTLTEIRTDKKTEFPYEQMLEILFKWMINGSESAEVAWQRLYGEDLPQKEEKEKVAPAQPKVSTIAKRAAAAPKASPKKEPAPESRNEKPEEKETFMPEPEVAPAQLAVEARQEEPAPEEQENRKEMQAAEEQEKETPAAEEQEKETPAAAEKEPETAEEDLTGQRDTTESISNSDIVEKSLNEGATVRDVEVIWGKIAHRANTLQDEVRNKRPVQVAHAARAILLFLQDLDTVIDHIKEEPDEYD